MKKSLSIILALVMALSLSVTAFAETNDGTQDTEITVNGSFVSGTAADEKISVDIVWDAMEFTYSAASQGTWNPTTHAYEGATAGGWSDNTPGITVKNHSNVAVKATLGFTPAVDGVVGTFTEASGTENDSILSLATAEGTEFANAPTATANFGISGAAIDADKSLGTITVAIAKAVETASVVTTFAELQAAVNAGGTVKLGGDIALDAGLNVNADTPVVIDLNGHTITGNGKSVGLFFGSCTIRGGSIIVEYETAVNNFGGNLTIDRCTLSSNNATLVNCASSAVTTVKNSTLIRNPDSEYVVFCDGGTISLEGTVNLSGIIYGNVTVLPGTYNFDITSYADADTYTVTDNGDGTWTVTAK